MHKLDLTLNEALYEETSLILEADDEKEVLEILENDGFISHDDFKNKYNLDSRGDIYK